jgi:hypothetical protein
MKALRHKEIKNFTQVYQHATGLQSSVTQLNIYGLYTSVSAFFSEVPVNTFYKTQNHQLSNRSFKPYCFYDFNN